MKQTVAALITAMLVFITNHASAELQLDTPQNLISQAKQGKSQLRDVINAIDQNLAEIRDVQTFDQYFFILDDLQVISDDVKLNTIYPDGVKKLGHRMVQKGINWLHIGTDSVDKLIYYHRWMSEPQPAFAALYSFEMQLKDLKELSDMEAASTKLEQLLTFSTQKWPVETSLLRLYRDILSDLAVKVLKTPSLAEEDVLFWITKIYRSESLSEVTVKIQDQIYQTNEDNKQQLHVALTRLFYLYEHSKKLDSGVSEGLQNQIGDSGVDLFLRSLRFNEMLSNQEFQQLLSLFSKRHYVSLAAAWSLYDQVPKAELAMDFMQKSFIFIQKLREMGLTAEANSLSRSITGKAASTFARAYNIEGYWEMKDRHGKKWSLNIIFADEDLIFANFAGQEDFSYPMFYVAYDMENSGFVAALRATDSDQSSNIPIRFFPQEDGTLKVINMVSPKADQVMIAQKKQTYPDLFTQKQLDSKANFNGIYEGTLEIIPGVPRKIEMAITTFNEHAVGNLKHPSFFATFNYGSNGKDNVLYLTRGNSNVLGSWMHLRLQIDENKNLVGYLIDGATGLNKKQIRWKKVRELTDSEEVVDVQ